MNLRRFSKALWLFVRWPLAVLTLPVWGIPVAACVLVGLVCLLVCLLAADAWCKCWEAAS